MNQAIDAQIADAIRQYEGGAYRARLVHDLILHDAAALGDRCVFLDIGCGKGFDSDIPLQESLARSAGSYIGVEPDTAVTPAGHVTDLRRGFFEQADIAPASVHVAFAIMVLEHLEHPQPFWDKLYDVLVPGGVFWGLTVDARHWFSSASIWSERLRVKDWYLNRLMGDRGKGEVTPGPLLAIGNTTSRVDFGGDPGEWVDEWSQTGIGHHWALCTGHRAADIRAAASLLGIPHRHVDMRALPAWR